MNQIRGFASDLTWRSAGCKNQALFLPLKLFSSINWMFLFEFRENIVVVLFCFRDMIKVINEQEASFDFYQFLGK